MKVQPVLLCGGSGTRLWPLSREQYPKQLLVLSGGQTMLQSTALRLDTTAVPPGMELAAPIVVVNEEYRFVTAEQLRQVDLRASAIVLEPVGRNTAPALTVAALYAIERGDDPILVVMPADHVIKDLYTYREAVVNAVALAQEGRIVTFGIAPTSPETGYGYIRSGAPIEKGKALNIKRFVEKPDLQTAREYLAAGDFLWNSGIFVVRASVWITALKKHRSDIWAACCSSLSASNRDKDFLRLDKETFCACPIESIDYAVMEKLASEETPEALAVIPLSAEWSDVGTWDSLWAIGEKNADENVLAGDVIAVGTRRTLVRAESRLVACVGLTDAVVVETADAVLVAHRDNLEMMRTLAKQLAAAGRPECNAHRKVYRPWGYYDSIEAGSRFQVKRIVVNPGAQLSLQMHHHRAEHWIVVVGTARITRGDETFLLSENQSTYIPLGTTHRLENPGKVPLELIEIQSGTYLGEDDIVRFGDHYGREVQQEKSASSFSEPSAA